MALSVRRGQPPGSNDSGPTVTAHSVGSGLTYVINMKHRNGTKGAGQWTINEKDEARCFELATHNHWLVAKSGWTLHLPNGEKAAWFGAGDAHVTRPLIPNLPPHQPHAVSPSSPLL